MTAAPDQDFLSFFQTPSAFHSIIISNPGEALGSSSSKPESLKISSPSVSFPPTANPTSRPITSSGSRRQAASHSTSDSTPAVHSAPKPKPEPEDDSEQFVRLLFLY